MLGTALSKKEDRLAEAASLMLKSGNFQEYCEIQKELGNFEDAIAVAPKVSLQYWQNCVTEYTNYLSDKNQMDEFVDYSILAGNYSEASKALE